MADLVAKMRVRTKVAGLLTLFGFAFMVAMAVKDNQNLTFGAAWCIGTLLAGDRFFKFLFKDLKRSREEVERDDG
jgi:hypothetical protein